MYFIALMPVFMLVALLFVGASFMEHEPVTTEE